MNYRLGETIWEFRRKKDDGKNIFYWIDEDNEELKLYESELLQMGAKPIPETQEIAELSETTSFSQSHIDHAWDKINELVRAINHLRKEK